MAIVGVREFRDKLSACLRRAREGERLVITDHGRPIAELGPAPASGTVRRARELVRAGLAGWSGGKPRGLQPGPRPRTGLVSDAVIADRR